jgi:hypothetical protein
MRCEICNDPDHDTCPMVEDCLCCENTMFYLMEEER